MLAIGVLKPSDPIFEMGTRMMTELVQGLYLKGRDFVAWHYERGGADRLWRILAAPPTRTTAIFHPETYSTNAAPVLDYADILNGLEERFGKRNWTVHNQEVGELSLRAVYAEMDPRERDSILANVEYARALVASDMDTVANVSFFVLRDRSQMPVHISAVEKMARRNIEKLRSSHVVKIEKPVFGDFRAIKADIARKITFTVKGDGVSYRNVFVRIGRGRAMVEFYMQGIELSDEKIGAVSEEIFRRLPANVTSQAAR